MLQRAALVLLLLILSGVAAIFAASHFGWPLPWQLAEQNTPDPASKQRDQAANTPQNNTPEAVIKDTVDALGVGTPEAAKPAAGGVELDISRISPDGSSVFAGRAEPDTYVTVLENGKPAGTVKADEHGEWSLVTEHKFASTDPKLTFEASTTPPAASTPAPPAKVAAADPQAGAAARSAAAVAGDALKKFETIVSQAREDAKRDAPQKQEKSAEKEANKESATSASKSPANSESPSTSESSGSASTVTANAASDLSATENDTTGTSRTTVIPVPIMFVYNEAKLTSEGQRAADLLLEYLTLKRLSVVELTGHADERGTDNYNFDLSRDRLDTVSQILRQGGYKGDLKLTPKGKTEPYEGVDRTAYKGEALYQLDRRVELRVTR
jgi:outer membrane protein OmpA-like peptidoglycan-associated protein